MPVLAKIHACVSINRSTQEKTIRKWSCASLDVHIYVFRVEEKKISQKTRLKI